jgi:hypothetical protein
MRKHFLLLIFSSFFGPLYAQSNLSVHGQVLDAISREPVVAATVTLLGHTGGTYTDTLGRFQLPVKSNKEALQLSIRCIGYNTWTGRLPYREDSQTILLEPAENELGTVVITATMK